MIVITYKNEKCFAELGGGCEALTVMECRGCKFYKPENCEDWIRVERGKHVELYPPEEYAEAFTPKETKATHWVIRRERKKNEQNV